MKSRLVARNQDAPPVWQQPRFWGAVYILLIPAFGTVYSQMGDAFYQSTALQETSSLDHDATNLLLELKQAMLAERFHGEDTVNSDGWTTNLRTCTFQDVGAAPASLNLGEGLEVDIDCVASKNAAVTVDYEVQAVIGPAVGETTTPLIGWHLVSFAPPTGNQEIVPGVSVPNPSARDFFFNLLGSVYIPDQTLASGSVGSFQLESQTEANFERFLEATQGDPNAFSNNLFRMSYFSATTITTLGLGDIVPITDASRALVALESVGGLIVIGLFLNSLASKYRRPNTPDYSKLKRTDRRG